MGEAWLSLLWTVVCVGAIGGLAYWFTRHVVGRHLGVKVFQKDPRLEVVSTVCLGREQQAAVVRAGKRLFLLGITQQNVSMLGELAPEEYPEPEAVPEPPGFREALKESMEKRFKR